MLKIFRWMESKRRIMQSLEVRDARMECVDREQWRGLVNDTNVYQRLNAEQ